MSSVRRVTPAVSAFTAADYEDLQRIAVGELSSPLPDPRQRPPSAPNAGAQSSRPDESTTPAPPSKPVVVYRDALDASALLGDFDPIRLFGEPDHATLERLLDECTVSTDGRVSRWTLRADVRRRVLNQLAGAPEQRARARAMANAYVESQPSEPSDITRILFAIADESAPGEDALGGMNKDQLAAYRAALYWLGPLDKRFGVAGSSMLGAIERAELLEPFRFLTGWDAETKRDKFVGREVELRRLREFVDALRSKGIMEAVIRGGRRLGGQDRRVLCFSGLGGVGKSTLLAKFILQHVDGSPDARLRFVYLDFDRSTLRAMQPVTMLLEALRQLSAQVPTVRHRFDALRMRVRAEIDGVHTSTGNTQAELIGPSLMSTFLADLAQMLKEHAADDQPLLIVIDTFEEAQLEGDQAVRRVEAFLEAAQQHLPRARVVIAGRDEVAGFFASAERLALVEFKDTASRVAFLEQRGVPHLVAATIAGQVGGRPLSLHLAARLVREHGADAASLSMSTRFRRLFNEYLIDGILYKRILEHIDDREVRAMVHPGLVLRRLDADVLQRVVAPAMNAPALSDERAAHVMSTLRLQKDLVRSDPDGGVSHRADVREQMLVLMREEKPELTIAIHAIAAVYYAERQRSGAAPATADRDRAEELYHRLSIGDSLDRMPALWSPRLKSSLAAAVTEIVHVAGRATLKVLLGREPDAEEMRSLPPVMLREYTTRAVVGAIEAQDPERAVRILHEQRSHITDADFRTIGSRSFDLAGRWREAQPLYDRIVDATDEELSLGDLVLAADFHERSPQSSSRWLQIADRLQIFKNREVSLSQGQRPDALLDAAIVRLRMRAGVYNSGRPALAEISPLQAASLRDGSSARSVPEQWLLASARDLESDARAFAWLLALNDTTRGQLTHLREMLVRELRVKRAGAPTIPFEPAVGVSLCDAWLNSADQEFSTHSSGVRTIVPRSVLAHIDFRSVMPFVLRHLLRPQTPQWYVPLASTMRAVVGGVIQTDSIYPASMPPLPFTVPQSLNSTRLLSDFLGRLDQLGVLTQCLSARVVSESNRENPQFRYLLEAFRAWRLDLFPELEGWFTTFDQGSA